jgi:hypothetical protein
VTSATLPVKSRKRLSFLDRGPTSQGPTAEPYQLDAIAASLLSPHSEASAHN